MKLIPYVSFYTNVELYDERFYTPEDTNTKIIDDNVRYNKYVYEINQPRRLTGYELYEEIDEESEYVILFCKQSEIDSEAFHQSNTYDCRKALLAFSIEIEMEELRFPIVFRYNFLPVRKRDCTLELAKFLEQTYKKHKLFEKNLLKLIGNYLESS